MSWGSDAASSGSGAASSASSMPSSAGGYSAPATSGFQLDNATTPTQGPTVAAGNMQTYGTENPSTLAVAGNTLERFQKGQGQSIGQTAKSFGNNPETYGYVSAKLQQMSKAGGGGGGAAPITTNISYQQPENGYLASRRRRY